MDACNLLRLRWRQEIFGENVKVVQELMRHANSRCTPEIYTQARTEQKRKAQQRLAEAIFPDDADIPAPTIQGISQDNLS